MQQHALAPVDVARPELAPVSGLEIVEVLAVRHWTEKLFSFDVVRPAAFRFRTGEFAMIGLPGEKKPLLRAYSMASPAWDDKLSFYSIKVPDGPLTSRLQDIVPGEGIYLRPRATGTLVLDALVPGERLVLISTGTGIAPFAGTVRDPETYDKFAEVVLIQTCRHRAELGFGESVIASIGADPLVGGFVGDRLRHVTTLTREPHTLAGRVTTLAENGGLARAFGGRGLDPETDRVMICGSMGFLKDMAAIAERLGFEEGANNRPGSYLVERAFVG